MSERSVRLHVHAPSQIDLTTRERVQLRRVEGSAAPKHGGLLAAGTHRLALEPGLYHFRTLNDASLNVVAGGQIAVQISANAKADAGDDPMGSAGDGPSGELPVITVTYE